MYCMYQNNQLCKQTDKKCSLCNNFALNICQNNQYLCNICYKMLLYTSCAPLYCCYCLQYTMHKRYYQYYKCSVCKMCHYSATSYKKSSYKKLLKNYFKLLDILNIYYYNLFCDIYNMLNFKIVETDKYIGIEFLNKECNASKILLLIANISFNIFIFYYFYKITKLLNQCSYQTYSIYYN